MTKAELRSFVKSFRELFPGWMNVRGEGFARISGPFIQQVWFENLRSGAYRPTSTVSILVMENGETLHQLLDHPHRQVRPCEHERKYPELCAAMREQFIPSIDSPLDEVEIWNLFTRGSTERIRNASSFAALSAYFGDRDDAKSWINVVKRLAQDGKDLWDWEHKLVSETLELEKALADGTTVSYQKAIRESMISRIVASNS